MNTLNSCSLIDRLRKPKIFGMSVFDWTCTLIAALLITYFYYGDFHVGHILFIFVLLVGLAILVHKITNTPTMLNYYLGLNSKEAVMQNRKNC